MAGRAVVAALVTVTVGGGSAVLGRSVGEASVAETLNRDSVATGDGQIGALSCTDQVDAPARRHEPSTARTLSHPCQHLKVTATGSPLCSAQ